jgi:hypothetical protein
MSALPPKADIARRVKLLSNGGPPMMRGEQHETRDRCNHSPDDDLPQFSSASRFTAGAAGFLVLIQYRVRPER